MVFVFIMQVGRFVLRRDSGTDKCNFVEVFKILNNLGLYSAVQAF